MNRLLIGLAIISVIVQNMAFADDMSVGVRVICDDVHIKSRLENAVAEHLRTLPHIRVSDRPSTCTIWLYAQRTSDDRANPNACSLAIVYTSRLKMVRLKMGLMTSGFDQALNDRIDDLTEDLEPMEHLNVVHMTDYRDSLEKVGIHMAGKFMDAKVIPALKALQPSVFEDDESKPNSQDQRNLRASPSDDVAEKLAGLDEQHAYEYGRSMARATLDFLLSNVKEILSDKESLETFNSARREQGKPALTLANYAAEFMAVFPATISLDDEQNIAKELQAKRGSEKILKKYIEGFETEARQIRMGR